MTNTLLPSVAEDAVGTVDSINKQLLISVKNKISRLDRVLTSSVAADNKTKLSQAEIIAAANGRLDNLPAALAALKSAVNMFAAGTYPA